MKALIQRLFGSKPAAPVATLPEYLRKHQAAQDAGHFR